MEINKCRSRLRCWICLVASTIFFALFILFLLQNTERVRLSFFLWSFSTPRIVLLLATLCIGFFIGVLVLVGLPKKKKISAIGEEEKKVEPHPDFGQELMELNTQLTEIKSKLHMTNLDVEAKKKKILNSSNKLITDKKKFQDTEGELKAVKNDLSKSATTISHLEEELIRVREEVDIKDFIDRMIQHDLRGSLIASVSLPESLLDDPNLTSNQKDIIGLIRDSGKNMLELIDSSLILYRIEEGTYINNPKTVNLFDVLCSVVNQISTGTDTNIDINCMNASVQDENRFAVHGDEFLILRIFMNLISNAMEASPHGKTISITLSKNESCSVAIRNYGAVPECIRDTFFDKMVTSGKKYGTGLGTYAAMLMAKAQGGAIELDCSEPGVTTIYVSLPLPPGE